MVARRSDRRHDALPIEEVPEHTYPKYPAPVIIQQIGAGTLVAKAWGIPITIKGPTKPIVKPVRRWKRIKVSTHLAAFGLMTQFQSP